MPILSGPGSANGLAGAFVLIVNYIIWAGWAVAIPNDVTNASQTIVNWILLTWLTVKTTPMEGPTDAKTPDPDPAPGAARRL